LVEINLTLNILKKAIAHELGDKKKRVVHNKALLLKLETNQHMYT